MKNGGFEVGTLIKGKDLKENVLCKILTEDMRMRDFQYQMGINEDINPFERKGCCNAGLHFCLAKDICNYIDYGTKLAVVKVPDEEDVYVDRIKFRTHRLCIEKIMPLEQIGTWDFLVKNGTDITAEDNFAVRYMSEYGYMDVVKYLHKHGADIRAENDQAVRMAASYGHLGVLRYLHENGADIHLYADEVMRMARLKGNMEIVKYYEENL